MARSSFTRSVQKRVHRRLWSFFGTERIKTGSLPTFFFLFQRVNARPLFGTDPRHFFLSLRSFYVSRLLINLMRFTPCIFAAIWRIKRRKLHHEKLQQKRLNLGKIMKSRCCLIRSFKNASLSYPIHCCWARSSCSLPSKRHKNSKKASSIVVWGTVSSACGLVSTVSFLWLYRFRSRKITCKRSLSVPRFSEDRAIF